MTGVNKTDIIIDPAIRNWVFIPIVIISFAVVVLRYYFVSLMVPVEKPDLAQIVDNHAMRRAYLLNKNGKYLPPDSFFMRRDFFVNEETGFLTNRIKSKQTLNLEMPMMRTFQIRITELLPMVIVGNFIRKLLSGFVVAKIPFPVTWNFKKLLQPEIFVKEIDNCWISSLAWYILNLAGLNSMCRLVYGHNAETYVNDTEIAKSHMTFKEMNAELVNNEYSNYLLESYNEFEREILESMSETTQTEAEQKYLRRFTVTLIFQNSKSKSIKFQLTLLIAKRFFLIVYEI
ncbi:ER membrane protein complex subunit 3-like isoform X2 [Teleopsis dalmanni]|nr:ER membrane protein complex subunit 3-like isoform X2 [Teleopsis dalmanni]